MNKNEALIQLKWFIERFWANIKQYTSNQYDEANTRVDFIDKFFELLGRDVSNNQWFSENYREVVREDKVKVSWNMKAPDYSFRLWGKRIFFVEAKKPSVDLKSAIGPAFQIRRYSWTAKLPLGILTDFEEFAVYDTRVKPDHEDKADNARIFYCKFDEYEKNRDFIYDTFSRDAILKWSFDRYITEGKKKGTSEVDKEFFKLITSRREDLAKNIYLRNKEIFGTDVESLGFIVQNIIDKIIFLRIAEDREIEEYGKLQNQLKLEKIDTSIYHQLIEYFVYADWKYDSSLFEVSSLLKQIKVDDKILKDIINSLYYPESPYAFSVLGVDILGNIYEQFLGRDIVQKNGTIYIEEKPEVKKAGWVYYTPKYIVEYIVKNTVGELLKKSKITDALKIKIVDPACGSWSFLIWAYTHLLDWYLEQYTKDKDIIKKSIQWNKIFQFGQYYHLTLPAKIEILKNNIHGVDIDEKAVEVTKLSLLLKLMEGETRETSRMLISGRDAKILPNLEDNIKCGNSLIGTDYRDNQKEVTDEMIKKINAFDREKQFPKIFENWGFDVVVGNPPYVVVNKKTENYTYYIDNYERNSDLYLIFMEKVFKKNLLKRNWLFGFITPRFYLVNKSSKNTRDFFINHLNVREMVETSPFESANTECLITILENNSKKDKEIKICIDDNWNIKFRHNLSISLIKKLDIINTFLTENEMNLLIKIKNWHKTLDDFSISRRGMEIWKKNLENEWMKVLIWWDANRYSIQRKKTYINAWNKEYRRLKDFFLKKNVIYLRRVAKSLLASIDNYDFAYIKNIYWIVINDGTNKKYILWLLNSKLLTFYYLKMFWTKKVDLFPEIQSYLYEQLPIFWIDSDNLKQKQQHDDLVGLVDQMLDTQKKCHEVSSDQDKKLYQQKIEILDNKIDNLVFDLYGLSEEERRVVLGG